MKNEDLFFMYRDISALFDDFCPAADKMKSSRGATTEAFFGYNNSIAGVLLDKSY